jgi:hypothetical protein
MKVLWSWALAAAVACAGPALAADCAAELAAAQAEEGGGKLAGLDAKPRKVQHMLVNSVYSAAVVPFAGAEGDGAAARRYLVADNLRLCMKGVAAAEADEEALATYAKFEALLTPDDYARLRAVAEAAQ